MSDEENVPNYAGGLVPPVPRYLKFVFRSSDEAEHAAAVVREAVECEAGFELMTGPRRVVVWAGSVDFDNRTLFMTDGAAALLAGRVRLPPSEIVPTTPLPPRRALLLGDEARDWDATGPRQRL